MLTTPETTVSITDDVLFSVRIRTYGGKKSNSKKAAEYSSQEGAKRTVMGVLEDLFVDDGGLRAIRTHRQTVDNWARQLGAPWGEQYYLTGSLIPELMKGYEDRKAEYWAKVYAWLGTKDEYESRINNALFQRGSLGKRSDYPSYEHVLSRFDIQLFVEPVPSKHIISQKFADLSEDLYKHYQRQHQQQVQGLLAKLSADMLRVLNSLSKGTETTTVKDKNGKYKVKKGRVFETTLDQAKRICETFREFNITADPALETARLQLEQALQGVTIDNIRTPSAMRSKVKQTVDDILRQFSPTAAQTIASSGMDAEELGQDEEFILPEISMLDEIKDHDAITPEVKDAVNDLLLNHTMPDPSTPDETETETETDFLSLLNQADSPSEVSPMEAFDPFAAFAMR